MTQRFDKKMHFKFSQYIEDSSICTLKGPLEEKPYDRLFPSPEPPAFK